MRIFLTGATGLVGRRLVLDRLERGDRLVALSRGASRARALFAADVNPNVAVVEGNPATPGSWQREIDGCDAVIHLAGAGVADRRWSAEYKKVLVDSRIDSTHQIVEAIEAASARPAVFVCASAIGYYGDRGSDELHEDAPPGDDFLARLAVRWEEQARRAEALGVRVARVRVSMVLDERGGALARMITPFRLLAGGPIGSGRQYVSWIHWRDLVGLVDLALHHPEASGALNAAAPNPVPQRELAAALGRALGRPSWLPAPGFALRVVLGEFARVLLASQRVVPRAAERLGYRFLYPEIGPALGALLAEDPDDHAVTEASRTHAAAHPAADADAPRGAAPGGPVRLLAVSVDGALLRSDQRMAPGVVQACRAAERAGCVIVLATARPPRGVRSIRQTLGLVAPTINFNGALIWNPIEDVPQYHEPLPPDVARAVLELARAAAPDVLVGLDVLDRWYTDRLDPRFRDESGRLAEPDDVGPLEPHLEQPVTKLNVLGAPADVERVVEAIREPFWAPRRVAIFRPEPHLLHVCHPLVDKGIALQRIARRLGVGREQTMAIGDDAQDMGMIEWAGFGVAVANAAPGVRALADAVVPSNDELGVARAIHRYVLIAGGPGGEAAPPAAETVE